MNNDNTIFILAEHRDGQIRDITWELLSKGRELATKLNGNITVLLLGYEVQNLAVELAKKSDEVIVINDEKLRYYNSEMYCHVLVNSIKQSTPLIFLIGHTAFGIDLAPNLATKLALPLATDCIDLWFEGESLIAIRQLYGGKVNAEMEFNKASTYLVTLRAGTFISEIAEMRNGVVKVVNVSIEGSERKRFIKYTEAVIGDIDITQANLLVSVGQGIGESKNIPIIEELARYIGGVVSCSRPVVDKKWLPKERQVGTSGKTVKPQVYLAMGISGAFQHLAGVKADTIIAINKDAKAPIFRVADYGIVGDLLQIVPLLKEKIIALKDEKK